MTREFVFFHNLLAIERPLDYCAFQSNEVEKSWSNFKTDVGILLGQLDPDGPRRWLLTCEDAYNFSVGLMGLLAAGKTVVIPPNFFVKTADELKEHFEAILSDENIRSTDREGSSDTSFACTKSVLDLDSTIELFTSGTTGEPKRVVKKLRQLVDESVVLEGVFGDFIAGTRVLGTVPHHHIYGLLFRLVWPLSAGRTIITELAGRPERLHALVANSSMVAVVSSPATLSRMRHLLDFRDYSNCIQTIFSSGGALSREDALPIGAAMGGAPFEILGSTETGGVAWRQQSEKAGSDAWTLLPEVSAETGDSDALSVTSPFTGGIRMVMGDSANFISNDRFYLGPRLDRIVKVEEKRISLAEVERLLREMRIVEDAAVVLLPGKRVCLGAAVVLFPGEKSITPQSESDIIRELQAQLAGRIDAVAVPRKWRFLDCLPFDERGKLSVQDVLGLFHQ